MVQWLVDYLNDRPDAQKVVVDAAMDVLAHERNNSSSESQRRTKEIDTLVKQQGNLATAIANGGELDSLLVLLRSVERQLAELRIAVQETQLAQTPHFEEMTRLEVIEQLPRVLKHLVESSKDFGDVLRDMFVDFQIQPVQALDTGQVRPRALLRLAAPYCGSTNTPIDPTYIVFDLFKPPAHIRLLSSIVELRESTSAPTYREIASMLGTNHCEVKRALAYARLMKERGLEERT